jgi:phenylpropionate dioxygenase-like ring-hydroxylating dioxygenase large terminal subunit
MTAPIRSEMSSHTTTEHMAARYPPEQVRDDFVPKEVYFDPDFARLEEQRLWPRVWQIACRLEELPTVGSFVTYDIVDDSILVVRTSESEIKAYHNVCPHRGRRLADGCGSARKFQCAFHGWQFNLDGSPAVVIDRHDWGGCLNDDEIRLREVRTGFWGGFVFINMDPGCEPLEKFLAPIDEYTSRFEFEKLRFRWYKSTIVPANWKTVLEFFNEFYHVQQTHRQLLPFTNDYSNSDGFGKHAAIWYPATGALPLSRSPRLAPREEPDFRNYILNFVETFNRDLKAMVTERNYQASQRLRTEVAADASPMEVMTKWVQFQIEAAEADGSGWPAGLTPEYIDRSKLDWHMFPNSVFLHGFVDGVLWYRARPNGHDPESAIFDVWSLQRYGPGLAPPLKREFYPRWEDGDWPLIFRQDFANIGAVQQGLHSRAFAGARTSPIQERAITHFHRTLRRFLSSPTGSID